MVSVMSLTFTKQATHSQVKQPSLLAHQFLIGLNDSNLSETLSVVLRHPCRISGLESVKYLSGIRKLARVYLVYVTQFFIYHTRGAKSSRRLRGSPTSIRVLLEWRRSNGLERPRLPAYVSIGFNFFVITTFGDFYFIVQRLLL